MKKNNYTKSHTEPAQVIHVFVKRVKRTFFLWTYNYYKRKYLGNAHGTDPSGYYCLVLPSKKTNKRKTKKKLVSRTLLLYLHLVYFNNNKTQNKVENENLHNIHKESGKVNVFSCCCCCCCESVCEFLSRCEFLIPFFWFKTKCLNIPRFFLVVKQNFKFYLQSLR